jgi:hypothetical protein
MHRIVAQGRFTAPGPWPLKTDIAAIKADLELVRHQLITRLGGLMVADRPALRGAALLATPQLTGGSMTAPVPSFPALEAAYCQWIKAECPHPWYTADRGGWLKANSFTYGGVGYRREASSIRSNSGKSITAWRVTFKGEDGSVVSNDPVLNRRNDPDRNWGAGRE